MSDEPAITLEEKPVAPPPKSAARVGWFRRLAHTVLQATHGRSTAFFIAFFISGNVLAAFGKLTPAYAGYMGMLGALILGHSVKEDVMLAVMGQPPPDADGGPHCEPGGSDDADKG